MSSTFVKTAARLRSISGLAWSGHGRVAAVEVSADGGNTWAEAALAEPVLPAALTRFRIPWEWTGEPAVLQSRVRDEFGHEQPTRRALTEMRGRHAYYHYNAIVSWAVDESGLIEHVYPEGEEASTELEDLFMDDAWD